MRGIMGTQVMESGQLAWNHGMNLVLFLGIFRILTGKTEALRQLGSSERWPVECDGTPNRYERAELISSSCSVIHTQSAIE